VRFLRAVSAADEVEVLAGGYRRGCYAVRNDFLVDRAALVVAWYDGSPGGTRYTLRRALARGREVWNLHPSGGGLAIRPCSRRCSERAGGRVAAKKQTARRRTEPDRPVGRSTYDRTYVTYVRLVVRRR